MNSGMLLRVAALRRIGGYSMDFWLDFSDRYVCERLLRIALRERKIRPECSRLLFTHLVRRFTVPKRRRLEEWRRTVSARRTATVGRTPGSTPS